MNPTILSVITVVYNARELLDGTLRSVLAQTWPHIEYIVVDGGSSDGTAGLIAAHSARIARWVSEPDKGIYDAMNKGLVMAGGDFVCFLNAGDRFFSPDTVEKMMTQCGPQTDVLYGEVMLVDAARHHLGTRSELTAQKLPTRLSWKSLRMGMVVCHQAFAVRRSLAPPYIENNLAADIDWVIRVLKQSRETVHTGLVIAEYLQGGVSKQRHRRSLRDRYAILKDHYGFWANLFAHALIILRAVIHRLKRFGKPHY
jgi:glycosyltransferase involved in cell wall biosynthesis